MLECTNMNFRNSFKALVLTIAFLATTGSVNASGSQCQVIYGGGQVCDKKIQFSIDKLVQIPSKGGEFVDNININDPKYQASQTVVFKIVISNTGKDKIETIKVTDTFPQFLSFVSGAGTWDNNAHTLTFDINNLDAGKAVSFLITAKVADDQNLPKDQSSICVANRVNATENNGASASDSSQVCITRVVTTPTPMIYQKVPVKDIPKTGPELLSLLGLAPLGAAGYFLRKKARLS